MDVGSCDNSHVTVAYRLDHCGPDWERIEQIEQEKKATLQKVEEERQPLNPADCEMQLPPSE